MNTQIKIFYFVAMLICFTSQIAFSQPQTEWVRQFNSGGSNQDYVNDMKLDKQGNIYMCGYVRYDAQNSDVLLLKYNSNGVLQWSRTYSGITLNSNDEAKKIILDDSGYIYLIGKVLSAGTFSDFLVMKYDPNGDSIWVRKFDGGNENTDRIQDIALDQNYNVYVTGILDRKGNSDIGTLKYDQNGNLKWVRIDNNSIPGSILSYLGNIFVCSGTFRDSINLYDVSVLKYDTIGNPIDTFFCGNSFNEGGELMLFDSNKNFIIATEFYSKLPTQYDILTLKISHNGNKSWSSVYNNNSDNSSDYLRDLKIDRSENICMLSRSRNAQLRSDIVLIKYDNQTGDSIWIKKYQSVPFSNDEPSQISIDKFDNIYITGSSDYNLINNRIVTIKYNTLGILQWHTEYTPSVFVNSEGLKILNDTLGNLFVSGITNSSQTSDDIVLIKYSHLTEIQQTSTNIPHKYELYQNHPNPFNSQTQIRFDLIKTSNYKLELFDMLGRCVEVLFNENKNKGGYSIKYNAQQLASGVYFYKLSSDDITITKKLSLIK